MQRLFGKSAPPTAAHTPKTDDNDADADDSDLDSDWVKVHDSTETLNPGAPNSVYATTTLRSSTKQDVQHPSTDVAKPSPRRKGLEDSKSEQLSLFEGYKKELRELRIELARSIEQGRIQQDTLTARIHSVERNCKDQALETSFRFKALRDHANGQAKKLEESTQRTKRWVQDVTTRLDEHEALLGSAEEQHGAHRSEVAGLRAMLTQGQDRQDRLEDEVKRLREQATTSPVKSALRSQPQEGSSVPRAQPEERRVHFGEDASTAHHEGPSVGALPWLQRILPARPAEPWTLEQHVSHKRAGAHFDDCPFCKARSAGPTDLWMM